MNIILWILAAVMSHGLTSCRYGMLPYARSYLKRGFSVVLYDQRNHGESGRSITTLEYQEKDDVTYSHRLCWA